MWGIDVSHHQDVINWHEVKRTGIQYVIMKAMMEKSHQADSRFEYNYYQSGLQELERGVYLYVIATDTQKAREEAVDLLNILHGRTLERGIWLDLEDPKIRGLGQTKLNEIIQVEARTLNSQGYQVGIYSNLDWYLHVLDGANLIKTYPWWLARYPKVDNGSIKPVLQPSNSFRIWQYSSKGAVTGITGPVDLDFDVCDLGRTADEIADDVLQGVWGNGQQRINRLTAAGYDVTLIQQKVNQLIHDRKCYPKYTGISFRIDEVFIKIGVEDQYIGNKHNRIPIAEANEIENYSGTLTQNLKLISLARAGELKRP